MRSSERKAKKEEQRPKEQTLKGAREEARGPEAKPRDSSDMESEVH